MKKEVKKAYKKIASGESCCLPEQSCCTADLSYYAKYLNKLPKNLNFKSLGCGTPLAFESLREGERVLDIGSGEGIEAIILSMIVGDSGQVFGLDFTDEMLRKGSKNAKECGAQNVRFVKGEAEEIPFSDNFFDLVVSNCVINLVEDKKKAIGEIFRVLKPGGRALISDITSEVFLPVEIRNDPELWSSCIGGAIPLKDYMRIFEEAGFYYPHLFSKKEIYFKDLKLFSITFKAVKLPSQIKIEAKEVKEGIFLFPQYPAWAKGDENYSSLLRQLIRGVDRENLLVKESLGKGFKKEVLDEFAFRQLLSSHNRGWNHKGRTEIQPNLKEVWLHLNQKCNLRCRYCLVEAGKEVEEPFNPKELKSILEEASALGAKRFYVTGGEPYLLKEYEKIFKLITNFGELIILTNATLIDENSFVPSSGKAIFQVSLDGTDKINDFLRGKGSFKQAVKGIKFLQSKGHKPVVASVVTKVNVHSIPELTSFLGEVGIFDHHLLFLHERGRAGKEDLTPPISEVLQSLEKALGVAERNGVSIDNYLAFAARLSSPRGKRYDLCHAGVEMITVGPEGEVYPCPSLVGERSFVLGDLRKKSLKEIWQNSQVVNKMRKASFSDCSDCKECEFRFYCGGGCLAYKFLDTGSLSGKDPYCDIYKYLMVKGLEKIKRDGLSLSPYSIPIGSNEVSVFNCA